MAAVTAGRRRNILVKLALGLVSALVVLLFGVGPYLLTGFFVSRRFVFPDRENAGLTPASFGLAFEDVTFSAQDGTTLRGWWVPAEAPRGSVVLVHGLNRSRIEMVRKLPFLHARGISALAFDLRHHGASDGALSSFGYYERLDVRAAVAEAKRRVPGPSVVWGVSLGAASGMLAAAEEPRIAGVVCDSTYRSLADTVQHHLELLSQTRWWLRPLPTGVLSKEVLFWIGRRAGFDTDLVDVLAAARALSGRPVLFVCNSGDRRMPMEIAFDLQRAANGHARVLVVPGSSHGGAYRDGRTAYEQAVAELLDEAGGKS